MTDDWRIHEEVAAPKSRNQRGHHRPWWHFNFISLALALFPLVYIRHLWNVHHVVIFACVFIIFVVWISAGWIGESSRRQAGGGGLNAYRLDRAIALLAVVLIAGLAAAIALFGSFIRLGSGRAFLFLLVRDPSALSEFVVLAIGFSIIIRRRAKYPEMARYALIGIGGLMFISVFTVLTSILGFPPLFGVQSRMAAMIYVWSKAIVLSLMTVACWVLIFKALLADRSELPRHGEPKETAE